MKKKKIHPIKLCISFMNINCLKLCLSLCKNCITHYLTLNYFLIKGMDSGKLTILVQEHCASLK